jgi:hypothetical protein
MKILLGDFNAKVGRDDIFKPTTGNESLHDISNDNGVTLINFVTSKNLRVKSTMFLHRNIHKYTWTFPGGKTHNQIDNTVVDRRRHDSDYYLVTAKGRERLAVNKQRSHRLHMERFNVQKLNEVEGKEQFRVEVSNRFAALERFRRREGDDGRMEKIAQRGTSPSTIRIIKSRIMRHVARMGEMRNTYRLLVGKPEGNRPLRRPRHRWANTIKMDLGGVGWAHMDWIGLAQKRVKFRTLVKAVMNLRVA